VQVLNPAQLDSLFWVSVIVCLILLVLSGLISGSEVAFFSLTPTQLEDCEKSNRSKVQKIVELLKNPNKLLATILISNNLINVAIVTISTVATWRLFGKESVLGIIIQTVLVTALIVFFGEILPKIYATQQNLNFAIATSRLLGNFESVLSPFAKMLTTMSNMVEKRIERKGYQISVTDLKKAVEISTTGVEATDRDQEILKGVVNFGSKTVKQIMCSRIDLVAFDLQIDFHDLMDRINKSGYSRVPVYEETVDQIKGILYIKDLLPHLHNKEDFRWQDLIHTDVFFVPDGKHIDDLLRDFQDRRVHMAIVVDEYGGTQGLVTLEDIIEEIVGDINDEFDDGDDYYRQIDAKNYWFEGKTSLNDLCKVLEIEPHYFEEIKGESESLGGLLLELFGRLPGSGEFAQYGNYKFTVVSANQKRIKAVNVETGQMQKGVVEHK
jgi:gliding motility-associated protein GldE